MVDRTIDFYGRNTDEFYNSTVSVDMSRQYEPFLRCIPTGCSILDAGYGSGRDSLYCIKQGYQVTAFDASEEMVRRSSHLIGQEVLQMSFDTMSFSRQLGGI